MSIPSNIHFFRSALPANVTLCAVSKFHSAADILEAYSAGQRVFGESRAQELAQKATELPLDIQWHFIGHLQTNKVALIAPFVALIHSVDSAKLLDAISNEAVKLGRTISILLEVHIAAESTKQGFSPSEVEDIMARPMPQGIKIAGLMGMATFTEDMGQVKHEFATLKALYDKFGTFTVLSMGMSNDYDAAIECGANMVRIGSSIFGQRI